MDQRYEIDSVKSTETGADVRTKWREFKENKIDNKTHYSSGTHNNVDWNSMNWSGGGVDSTPFQCLFFFWNFTAVNLLCLCFIR